MHSNSERSSQSYEYDSEEGSEQEQYEEVHQNQELQYDLNQPKNAKANQTVTKTKHLRKNQQLI